MTWVRPAMDDADGAASYGPTSSDEEDLPWTTLVRNEGVLFRFIPRWALLTATAG
jgi:hypothetical protein